MSLSHIGTLIIHSSDLSFIFHFIILIIGGLNVGPPTNSCSDWREQVKTFLVMAFFLVDVEFRKKAKHLLTTKEVLFCIFFCVFALVPWMDIAVFAGHRLFGRNGTFLPDGFWDDDKTTMFSDFFDTTSTSDDTPTMEGTSCSPKFPKLCVPKT